MNDRFLRALRRQPVDRTPVWLMRQAGRYLPEYRATRERAGNFLTLCKTPELACEVTLQPLERFALDAAILFSDILTIPDAMGLGLSLEEGAGPVFEFPIRHPSDIDKLGIPDPSTDLRYVISAVEHIRQALAGKLPLIGFAGSPFTLATYMIEGRSSREFNRVKGMLYDEPHAFHKLLDILARSITDYLNAQIDAGVDAVMLFDTWGGILTTQAYQTFSLEYMRRIVDALEPSIPTIIFTKGGGQWIEHIADSGCNAVGLDWTTDIGQARVRVGDRAALQGNMDPAILRSSEASIRREVQSVLSAYGDGPGHVFNLGHGITPDIDPGHVAVFVDGVHELSAPFHENG